MNQASPGDEVYFHYKGEPKTGKVVCAGRHGCIVDEGGKRHKLKWHQLAGHKSRTPMHYRVVDQGEDGIIVECQHGKRRLLRVPQEARAGKSGLTADQVAGTHK